MAEGFARALGRGVITAASAGLSPTATVARDTVLSMAEIGIDIGDQFPKEFDLDLANTFDVIVNLSGFDLPPMETAIVAEWKVRDPYCEDSSVFREVRGQIERRVRDLIEDIRQNGTLTHALGDKKPGLWQKLTDWR
jgi:arsenate reductase